MQFILFPVSIFDMSLLLLISTVSFIGTNLYMLYNHLCYYLSIGRKIDTKECLSIMLCLDLEKSDYVFFCGNLIRFFIYMTLGNVLAKSDYSRHNSFIYIFYFLFVLAIDTMIDWSILRLSY